MAGRLQKRQSSDSFLVRCWKEPREVDGQPDVVRVYVRNLRSGEEHYLNNAGKIGELIERSLYRPADAAIQDVQERSYKVG